MEIIGYSCAIRIKRLEWNIYNQVKKRTIESGQKASKMQVDDRIMKTLKW